MDVPPQARYLPAAILFNASLTSSSAVLISRSFSCKSRTVFMRIDLFVAERDQRQDGFVRLALLGGRRVRRAGRFPRRDHAELVFQLQNDSLRRFFAEPADLRERGDIGVHDRALEIAHAHPAQDRQGELRADPADVIDEQAEKIALRPPS